MDAPRLELRSEAHAVRRVDLAECDPKRLMRQTSAHPHLPCVQWRLSAITGACTGAMPGALALLTNDARIGLRRNKAKRPAMMLRAAAVTNNAVPIPLQCRPNI